MKKVTHPQPKQDRRRRVLERFQTNPKRKDDVEYMARKAVERAALEKCLGHAG